MKRHQDDCPVRGRLAGWARVSMEDRDESSQVEQIEAFARRIGQPLVRTYRDPGRKRSEMKESEEIKRMLRDAEEHAFDWLICCTQDRIGTAHAFQLFGFLNDMLDLGVRVWVIDREKELTSIDDLDIFTTVFNSQGEIKEQRTKAGHVARGLLSLARAGLITGGAVPYGFDKICIGIDGKERFRAVHLRSEPNPHYNPNKRISKFNQMSIQYYRIIRADGSEEVIPNKPPKAVGEHFAYAISILPERVETVREIFRRFAEESVSRLTIAKDLNRSAPDEASRGKWTYDKVRAILDNPIYYGVKQYLKKIAAKYQTIDKDDRYVLIPVTGARAKKTEVRPEDERIYVDVKHAAIIDEDIAAKVRERLKDGGPKHSPRDADLWLSPWMTCGECGGKMNGRKIAGCAPEYRCWNYTLAKRGQAVSCATPNRTKATLIEPLLRKWLEDQGEVLTLEVTGVQSPRLESFLANDKARHGLLAGMYEQMEDYVRDRLPESQRALVGGIDGIPVFPTYRQMFAEEQSKIQGEIDALTAAVTRHSLSLSHFSPGEPAHEAILAEIRRLQDEIAVAKPKLVPLDKQIGQVIEMIRTTEKEIRETIRSLDGRRNRKAAAVLGKILSKIEVFSEPSGYGKGGMGMSRVVKVTFHPVMGEPRSYEVAGRDRQAIADEVVRLRREGLTVDDIADRLQEAGYPTWTADRWKYGAVYSILQAAAPEMLSREFAREIRVRKARETGQQNPPRRGRPGPDEPSLRPSRSPSPPEQGTASRTPSRKRGKA